MYAIIPKGNFSFRYMSMMRFKKLYLNQKTRFLKLSGIKRKDLPHLMFNTETSSLLLRTKIFLCLQKIQKRNCIIA